ncbi:hypothetical protein JCM10213v2_003451 [Rhodosporidiobolus nylandii]
MTSSNRSTWTLGGVNYRADHDLHACLFRLVLQIVPHGREGASEAGGAREFQALE